MKLIKITPDDKVIEMPEEQADADKGERFYDGVGLMVPEKWKHKKKFRLTVSFPDLYEDTDKFNKLATLIVQKLHHEGQDDNIICGDAYIANESDTDFLDFTLEDFRYVLKKGLKLKL